MTRPLTAALSFDMFRQHARRCLEENGKTPQHVTRQPPHLLFASVGFLLLPGLLWLARAPLGSHSARWYEHVFASVGLTHLGAGRSSTATLRQGAMILVGLAGGMLAGIKRRPPCDTLMCLLAVWAGLRQPALRLH